MTRKSIQVVGLGQACVDFLGRLPSFPQEDQKVELLEIHQQCGGPASTAMVTLARLGVRTSFVGAVSDDPLGLQIVEALKQEGVDLSHLKIRPGYTSQFAFIGINKDNGARTIFWHRGSVPHLSAKEVDLSPYSGAKVLHLDGLMIEASIKAALQAKDLGMTVVMDGGTMREGSQKLVSLVDVLIASERFAEPLVGPGAHDRALRVLRERGPKTVVITLGAGGSIAWDGNRAFSQNAFAVKALDTTGAGDVYHGAYIYGLVQEWSIPECMRFASAAAALKCRAIGARNGIPGLKEVDAFMLEHPET